MKVIVELQAPAVLFPERYATEVEAGWAPKPVWTDLEKRNN
jgi:hypothetical protein